MWNIYDLEAAEAHWHQLQDEAANERLVRRALRDAANPAARLNVIRLLERLRGNRPNQGDPKQN